MRKHRRAYYPTKREAYGPRRQRTLVEDRPAPAASLLPAWAHVVLVEVAMPHGGVRVYARCPECGRHCAHLYEPVSASVWLYVCRRCAGLVYWS
jgi:hypothetical protein